MVNGWSVLEALEGRRLFSFPIGVGGEGADRVVSVAADKYGNVLAVGTYQGTVDFDPGSGVRELVGGGGFVAKYDPSGALLWARSFAGVTPAKVAVDWEGEVFFVGSFKGTVDFDPRRGVYPVMNQGGTDGFVCKLTPKGYLSLVGPLGGRGEDAATGLAVDRSGVMYVGGTFEGTVNLVNPTRAGDYDLEMSADEFSPDGYLASFDPRGRFRWLGSFSGDGPKTVADLALDDAGNVLATGRYTGTVDFDPTAGGTARAPDASATPQAYVLKWGAATGRFVWVAGMGGAAGTTYATSVAADRAGNVYTTGAFADTADFDPGAGSANLTAPASGQTFVSKLDAAGAFVWARAVGGSTAVGFAPGEVAVDKAQNVYTTGRFSGTRDFDPGGGTANLTSAGLDDVFVSKLDSGGALVFARRVGGTTADVTAAAVLERDGNLVVAGSFTGTANFATTGPALDLLSNGDEDAFVVKVTASGDPA